MLKTRFATTIILGAIILSACGGVTPYPTPSTPSATFVPATTTPILTATSLPSITPTPWNTPISEMLEGYPTPEVLGPLPTCETRGSGLCNLDPDMQRQDISFHELYVGKYVLRNWCDRNYVGSPKPCPITISSIGAEQIEIWGTPAWIRGETGSDLTGDGIPDIVIEAWDGSLDDGSETIVYEADNTLKKIMDVWSQDPGNFTDINGDGTYEYTAPTVIYSQFCFDCNAWTPIVYEYQRANGYLPATYKFKDSLSLIQTDLDYLANFKNQNPNMPLQFNIVNGSNEDNEYWKYATTNWDYYLAVTKLYDVIIYYLLSGYPKDAQKVLNDYFPPDQASEFMIDIQKDIKPFLSP